MKKFRWVRYLLVVFLIAIALALTFGLQTWISEAAFPIFLVAVCLCAWTFGRRYAIMAVGLSLVFLGVIFPLSISATFPFDSDLFWRTVAFVLVAAALAWLADEVKRSRMLAKVVTQAETEAREQTRSILESINESFFSVDRDWRITYTNGKATELAGRAGEDLRGYSFWAILPGLTGGPEERELRRQMRDRRPISVEVCLRDRDAYYQIRGYPSSDRLLLFFQDVTDRRLAEEQLKKREEQYRMFVQQSTEGIWRIDFDEPIPVKLSEADQLDRLYRQGRVSECNEVTARLRGLRSSDELIGLPVASIFPAESNDSVQLWTRFLRSGFRLEDAELHVGDHYLLTSVIGVVEDSLLVRCWGADRDVTERKQAEETRRLQSEELARSNADLDQFASAVSHDLQEPLRTVVSYSQLLSRRYGTKLDGDAQEMFELLEGAGRRMHSLVTDLLAYSKVSFQIERDAPPVDLNSVFTTVLANLSVAIGESGACVTADPLPTVNCNETQMAQVFQNLVGNALKYRRPEAAPRIHISAWREPRHWVLRVRDNGQGIPAEYAEKVFGVFKRLHGQEVPGTGIGLALAKRIVERHRGRIWLESRVGQGSDFFFTLPADGG